MRETIRSSLVLEALMSQPWTSSMWVIMEEDSLHMQVLNTLATSPNLRLRALATVLAWDLSQCEAEDLICLTREDKKDRSLEDLTRMSKSLQESPITPESQRDLRWSLMQDQGKSLRCNNPSSKLTTSPARRRPSWSSKLSKFPLTN
jgi:hypothetical protein